MPQDIDAGLRVERRGAVVLLTLDRQQRLNALSSDLMVSLVDAFDDADRDPSVRAVLVTGAGNRAFSSGRDLKEDRARDRSGERHRRSMKGIYRNLFETVLECRKPTVAAINGWAVGGGFELALACDLRIAADHARFAMPEGQRGMGANFGAQMLPRLAPRGVAYQILYLGEEFTAQEMERWGLVNWVVPGSEVQQRGADLAQEVANRAPLTLQRFKANIQRGMDLTIHAALRLDAGPDPYDSEDRVEGVRAFVEDREPSWKGR